MDKEQPDPTGPAEATQGTGSWSIGPVGLLVMVLFLAVSCYAGWRVFDHLAAPATPVDATAAAIDPSPLPSAAAMGVGEDPADREVASPDPGPPRSAHAAADPLLAEADLPAPTPPALHASIDEVEPAEPANPSAAAHAAVPPTPDPRITEISERLDRLELVLVDIRDRLTARLEPPVAAASAPVAANVPATAVPEPHPVRKPVRTASKPAPQTISNGQLLSIDMWGGVPSVVVGTGLPDDKRVRVLKRGDVYNGVALLNVNPVARTATFGANGRSFILSVNQGG